MWETWQVWIRWWNSRLYSHQQVNRRKCEEVRSVQVAARFAHSYSSLLCPLIWLLNCRSSHLGWCEVFFNPSFMSLQAWSAAFQNMAPHSLYLRTLGSTLFGLAHRFTAVKIIRYGPAVIHKVTYRQSLRTFGTDLGTNYSIFLTGLGTHDQVSLGTSSQRIACLYLKCNSRQIW